MYKADKCTILFLSSYNEVLAMQTLFRGFAAMWSKTNKVFDKRCQIVIEIENRENLLRQLDIYLQNFNVCFIIIMVAVYCT